MAKGQYLTQEGLEKLREELNHMISVERPAISKAIAEARDKGDLSENAEYDAAREAQGLLELKISKLQDLIANAKIIDESKISTEQVGMLNKVTVKNLKTGARMVFTLVGESEANLAEGKLAVSTPIGKALFGRKKGEVVDVNAPAGIIKFEILEISI
ncbi:MAG: transcription elongation factor GreA [Bacteroidales bacterium]|nr:transcription elongation factor GreA [Bacteroidales bacterium]MBR4805221.1 transcription elongation factor GreA [Bacteroidales bacterium]MBR4980092.1 transcription elongation factor GreA [Bacteroidales bacterium]MBR5906806.1 transcription elongation factor GreA [Bacteroidales bacterium]